VIPGAISDAKIGAFYLGLVGVAPF